MPCPLSMPSLPRRAVDQNVDTRELAARICCQHSVDELTNVRTKCIHKTLRYHTTLSKRQGRDRTGQDMKCGNNVISQAKQATDRPHPCNRGSKYPLFSSPESTHPGLHTFSTEACSSLFSRFVTCFSQLLGKERREREREYN